VLWGTVTRISGLTIDSFLAELRTFPSYVNCSSRIENTAFDPGLVINLQPLAEGSELCNCPTL
jgi:hypothetical protein